MKEYFLAFQPQGAATNADFGIALDMMNFDPNNAAESLVRLEGVEVYRVPEYYLQNPSQTVTIDFKDGTQGWASGFGAPLIPHEFSTTCASLRMASVDNSLGFGFWQSPDNVFTLEPENAALIKMYISTSSTGGETPTIRARALWEDGQMYQYTQMERLSPEQVITMIVLPPVHPGYRKFGVALDMLSFNSAAPNEFSVDLEKVTVTQIKLPVVPRPWPWPMDAY
jgi:hypothetical protein